MKNQTFLVWLRKQKKREDSIGELSRSFINSGDKSPGCTRGAWIRYLIRGGSSYPTAQLAALEFAFDEWLKC